MKTEREKNNTSDVVIIISYQKLFPPTHNRVRFQHTKYSDITDVLKRASRKLDAPPVPSAHSLTPSHH